MRNIKVLSLFSGIGAFEKALKNLNIDYELVGYSETDKYASKAYYLIHSESESKNLGDITKIDINALPKNIDLITYGFPCQDISAAGNKQGFFNNKGEKTRSGLFFNALNIIQAVKPKISIAENVKNLTGKRFKNEFEIVLNSLAQAGYNNYFKVLNAKNYGIPQNRERVFIVSIRKDIDNGLFEFPQPIELTKRLKDILENKVDEKYYISDEKAEKIRMDLTNKKTLMIDVSQYKRGKRPREYNDIAPTLTARDYKEPRLIQVGKLDIKGQDNIKRVYSVNGIFPTLTNMQGGNRQPKIVASRGRYVIENGVKKTKQHLEINTTGNTNALTTVQKDNYVLEPQLKVRKLTPKEYFRLMGFEDKDVDVLIENNISNTQIYKMGGNSIVVNVLEHILSMLYQTKGDLNVKYK